MLCMKCGREVEPNGNVCPWRGAQKAKAQTMNIYMNKLMGYGCGIVASIILLIFMTSCTEVSKPKEYFNGDYQEFFRSLLGARADLPVLGNNGEGMTSLEKSGNFNRYMAGYDEIQKKYVGVYIRWSGVVKDVDQYGGKVVARVSFDSLIDPNGQYIETTRAVGERLKKGQVVTVDGRIDSYGSTGLEMKISDAKIY